MNSCSQNEAPVFESLKFIATSKWNIYKIHCHYVGKRADSVDFPFEVPDCSAMLCLYEKKIKAKTDYPCHIWVGVSQNALSRLERVQNRLHRLVRGEVFILQSLPCRLNASIPSLFPWNMFRWTINFLVSPVQSFTARIHNVTSTESKHPQFFHVPYVRKSFFLRAVTLCNRDPRDCFSKHYNFTLSLSILTLIIFTSYNLFFFKFISHNSFLITNLTLIIYLEWLSNYVLSNFSLLKVVLRYVICLVRLVIAKLREVLDFERGVIVAVRSKRHPIL